MKIRVTRQHILDGEPYSCADCPIALAIKAACKSDVFVFVRHHWAMIGSNEKIPLPPEAERFIVAFDYCSGDADYPQPFEFELPDFPGSGRVWL